MAGRCPAGRLRRPVLAGGVVGAGAGQQASRTLRHTDEGERFDDFAIRQQWWTGDALPDANMRAPGTGRVLKVEVVGRSKRRWRRSSGTRSPRSGPTWPESRGNRFRYFVRQMERNGHSVLDIAALIRHDACMDRRALERLGHHVVSRRVALGYRNRTDLADSLQFTVRTLADIEHGVRKASPGTYAMLENKLAWAPGASTPSWRAGNPKSWCPHCAGATPTPRPRDTHCARPTPTLSPTPPPRSCCWSYDAASSPPATDATKPGTTGAALTRKATGPRRGHERSHH